MPCFPAPHFTSNIRYKSSEVIKFSLELLIVSYLNCQTKVKDTVFQSVFKWFHSFSCEVIESVNVQIYLKIVVSLQQPTLKISVWTPRKYVWFYMPNTWMFVRKTSEYELPFYMHQDKGIGKICLNILLSRYHYQGRTCVEWRVVKRCCCFGKFYSTCKLITW